MAGANNNSERCSTNTKVCIVVLAFACVGVGYIAHDLFPKILPTNNAYIAQSNMQMEEVPDKSPNEGSSNSCIRIKYEDVGSCSILSGKLQYPNDALSDTEMFLAKVKDEKPIEFLGVSLGSSVDTNIAVNAYSWEDSWFRIVSEGEVFGEHKRLSVYFSKTSRTIFAVDVSYHFDGEHAYEEREKQLESILSSLSGQYGISGTFLLRSKQKWADENAKWLAEGRKGAGGIGTAEYDLGNGIVCRVRCHDGLGRENGKESASIYVSFIYPRKMFLAWIESGKEHFHR